MKLPRVLLPLTACIVITAAGVYYFTQGGKTGLSSQSAPSQANTVAKQGVHPNAAVPLPQEKATGHDGEYVTAPKRLADSMIDVQSASVSKPRGEKISATISAGSRVSPEMVVNAVGEFPRAYVEPAQEVTVRFRMDDAQPGSRVVAQAEDGGRFPDGKPVEVLNLDERREASFRFVSGTAPGQYRISLRHGPDWKVLQLWVGPAPTVARK